MKPGICNIITKYLRKKVNTLNKKDRYCVLMWDEMALMPHIQYDSKYDVITGFEDWGMRRTNKFADHALVFMIRGLYSGWIMPVFFGYCENLTKTPQLMRCIKKVISVVHQTGLKIVATVCDRGTANVAAIKMLLKDTARDVWKEGTECRT